jgi:hypothetical protein
MMSQKKQPFDPIDFQVPPPGTDPVTLPTFFTAQGTYTDETFSTDVQVWIQLDDQDPVPATVIFATPENGGIGSWQVPLIVPPLSDVTLTVNVFLSSTASIPDFSASRPHVSTSAALIEPIPAPSEATSAATSGS